MKLRNACLALLLPFVLAPLARAENWPQFRGPSADGQTSSDTLPSQWGEDAHVAWKVKIPGVAWSQPIVWNDRIYVTTAVTEKQTKPDVASQRGGPGGGGPGGGGPGGGRRGPRPEGDGDGPPADRPRPDRPNDGAENKGAENADRPRPEGDAPRRGPRGGGGAGGGGPGRGGYGRNTPPPDQTYRWMVMCLDRTTGKVIWEELAHEGKPTIPMHRTNTYASETPVTDGQHVFAYFGMTGLYAYDMNGKLAWKKNLGSFPMSNGWGTGSSPILDGDRLIVQCDNEQESFLVALDKHTGDELWRVPREERSNWSTPYLWKNAKRTELVTAGGGRMRSYDPATGKLLWELSGIRGRCSATPVGIDELLYLGVGGGMGGAGPLVAIRAGASGEFDVADKDSANIGWTVPRAGPPMASPLVYRDKVYVLEQRGGIIGCYDARSGKEIYHQRIEGATGFTASPWAADGKIFCLDASGQTFVLDAGDTLNVVATNKLDDQFWSSVAVAGNQLLLRGVEHLYAIDAK